MFFYNNDGVFFFSFILLCLLNGLLFCELCLCFLLLLGIFLQSLVFYKVFFCRRRCLFCVLGINASTTLLYMLYGSRRSSSTTLPGLFVRSSRRSSSTTLILIPNFLFFFTVKLGNTDYPALRYGITALGRHYILTFLGRLYHPKMPLEAFRR